MIKAWIKYYFLIIFVGFVACTIYSQSTFSAMIDIGEDDKRNSIPRFDVLGNHIFTHTFSYCPKGNDDYEECIKLTKFDFEGNLVKTIILDSVSNISGCSECLTSHQGELLLSANHKDDDFSNIYLYRLNTDLEIQQIYTYPVEDSNSQTVNRGIVLIDSSLYIYTRVYNYVEEIMKMRIIKLDANFEEVWRHSYFEDDKDLTMWNLRKTPEGNLAFNVQFRKPVFGPSDEEGYALFIVNSSNGQVIDSIKIDDILFYVNDLLVDSDGFYYFNSTFVPYEDDDLSFGRFNKLNSDWDSVHWSIELKTNLPIYGRGQYNIQTFIELANGDILVGGIVEGDFMFKELYEVNNIHNGFLVRLTPEGEAVWTRVFKLPNKLLPQDEYGYYTGSAIYKIIELENGKILLLGGIIAQSGQYSALAELGKENWHLWLMLVNEDGCLDQYPCQEVIILDDPSPVMDPWFPVGTKWTYEYYPETSDPEEVIHSYIDFYVTGTYWQNEELVYHIENNRGLPNIKMKQDGQKTWFWHPEKKVWQLTYDFYAQFSYPVQWEEDKTLEAELYKPMYSIPYTGFGTRNAQDLQYVRIIDEEDTLVNKTILTTLGGYSGGITFDNHPLIGEIRCFTHDTFFYNFTSGWPHIPCDTIYSNQPDAVINAPTNIPIQVYPNPTNHRLYVQLEGYRDVRYKIVDIAGVVQKVGRLEESILVDKLKSGSYVVQFFTEQTFLAARKFFKFE